MSEKIRIGLIVNAGKLQFWQYKIIQRLLKLDFVEINLIINVNDDAISQKENRYSAFYQLHHKLDKTLYSKDLNYDSFIDVQKLLNNPLTLEYRQAGEDQDVKQATKSGIKDSNLDLLLNFGLKDPVNYSFDRPRYGIFSISIGNNLHNKTIPPAYWEVMKQMPELILYITVVRNNTRPEAILNKAYIPTLSSSIRRNLNQAYGVAALLIPRIVKGLYQNGLPYLDKLIDQFGFDLQIIDSRYVQSPGPYRILLNLMTSVLHFFLNKIFYLDRDKWFLLYQIKKTNDLFPAIAGNFKVLKPKGGKFWADPFVICRDGINNLFIEEYLYNKKKAHISLIKLSDTGQLISCEKIIERPYHLSYPFIFTHRDKYYMIPESKEGNAIQLFVSTDFPAKWEFVMNIMENVAAADSTLFLSNNKWWLFTSIDEMNDPEIAYHELFLYYSDDFMSGKWSSHPLNPIVTDIKTSRPAGKIYLQWKTISSVTGLHWYLWKSGKYKPDY